MQIIQMHHRPIRCVPCNGGTLRKLGFACGLVGMKFYQRIVLSTLIFNQFRSATMIISSQELTSIIPTH